MDTDRRTQIAAGILVSPCEHCPDSEFTEHPDDLTRNTLLQ